MHIRRIINRHADNPSVIHSAIAVVSGVSHVHDPVHKSQSTAFFLHQGSKGHAVVSRGGVYIYRPARIGSASVHVQGVNKMLLGRAIDQCIEEKSSGGEIDHGRAGDASRIDISAGKTEITAGPKSVRCQITVPVVALSA